MHIPLNSTKFSVKFTSPHRKAKWFPSHHHPTKTTKQHVFLFLLTSLQFESNPLNTKHTRSIHPSFSPFHLCVSLYLLIQVSSSSSLLSLSPRSLSQTYIITNYKWIFSSKLFSTLVFHQLCYIDDYDVLLYTVSQTKICKKKATVGDFLFCRQETSFSSWHSPLSTQPKISASSSYHRSSMI